MIVITGGNGVLGKALSEQLAEGGEPVTLASRHRVDLGDPAATLAFFKAVKPRLVYHLAARVHGLGGNARYPAEMYTDNIRINTNVIDAAHQAGCEKIVAVSTVAIYSSDAPKPVDESSIWFDQPHHGEKAYGHAKRGMLAQLEAYNKQYGLSFAYPIMTNLYGPHDRFDPIYGHVVPSLVVKFHRAIEEGTTVDVWGSGRAERDFLFASDAARALRMIAERHEGPINVASGTVWSIRNIVEMLQRHTGIANVVWDDTKPDGELLRRYNIDRLKAIGFAPEVPIEEGLARTYDWYRQNYPDVRMVG